MNEENENELQTVTLRFIDKPTGEGLSANLARFLEPQFLKPQQFSISTIENRFQFIFDYYNLRYHLLLERNNAIKECRENECLQELYVSGISTEYTITRKIIPKFLDLFLPFVAKDCEERDIVKTAVPSIKDRYLPRPVISIQLKTFQDGLLHQAEHAVPSPFPLSQPVETPSLDAPLFEKDSIELLEEIHPDTFKANVKGIIRCVKVSRREELLREIAAFERIPSHPNILSPLIGLVKADEGHVDQLVIPFVNGVNLFQVKACSLDLKEAWKKQITEALHLLHSRGIAWGDAHGGNVLIESGSSRAVLIDFDQACCRMGEGVLESYFEHVKSCDLERSGRIIRHIDNLKAINSGSELRLEAQGGKAPVVNFCTFWRSKK